MARRATGGAFFRPGRSGAAGALDEVLTGRGIERADVDKGCRGRDAPKPGRVFRSGQKPGVQGRIEKQLRRRSAIEAAIGHGKTDGRLGRDDPVLSAQTRILTADYMAR